MAAYYFDIVAFVYMLVITVAFLTKKKNETAESFLDNYLNAD